MTATLPDAVLRKLTSPETLPEVLPSDPFALFKRWYDAEQASPKQPNPNAMTLTTVDADGWPSARPVLCRGIGVDEGFVTFFTNYESRKGRALQSSPKACLCFHWDHSDRVVRIEGEVVRSDRAESDTYWAGRRWESRLAAMASAQSQPIASREALYGKVAAVIADLGVPMEEFAKSPERVDLKRPDHWGGWRVYARAIELWIGGPGRLHDRARWERRDGGWVGTRLQP